jgi:hypothetical protein
VCVCVCTRASFYPDTSFRAGRPRVSSPYPDLLWDVTNRHCAGYQGQKWPELEADQSPSSEGDVKTAQRCLHALVQRYGMVLECRDKLRCASALLWRCTDFTKVLWRGGGLSVIPPAPWGSAGCRAPRVGSVLLKFWCLLSTRQLEASHWFVPAWLYMSLVVSSSYFAHCELHCCISLWAQDIRRRDAPHFACRLCEIGKEMSVCRCGFVGTICCIWVLSFCLKDVSFDCFVIWYFAWKWQRVRNLIYNRLFKN